MTALVVRLLPALALMVLLTAGTATAECPPHWCALPEKVFQTSKLVQNRSAKLVTQAEEARNAIEAQKKALDKLKIEIEMPATMHVCRDGEKFEVELRFELTVERREKALNLREAE